MLLFYEPKTGQPTHTLDTEDPKILARQTGAFVEIEDLPADLASLRVVDGKVEIQSLDRDKAHLVQEINETIGAIRVRFITAIPGQEMLYLMKAQEAQTYLSQTPDPADLTGFPLMAAEVGLTCPTAYELAQLWLNMNAQLTQIGSILENLRLDAVAKVRSAQSLAEAREHMARFSLALEEKFSSA